ncbi:MAG: GNAT family N-acetyltransferase [Ectothiorhodospiraceae bacterium]|nr:GNAT family N-acetyltransferase [Ectothiorhodospiraceae bacterium]
MEQIAYDDQVRELLLSCGLPVDDLRDSSDVSLFGLRHEGILSGVVGIQTRDDVGLLRSLAISDTRRGEGLGRKLVAHAEAWAAARGLNALYLLTTTADAFFQRLGYVELPRSAAPLAITETREFAELCPASSVFMCKHLGADHNVKPAGFSAGATARG